MLSAVCPEDPPPWRSRTGCKRRRDSTSPLRAALPPWRCPSPAALMALLAAGAWITASWAHARCSPFLLLRRSTFSIDLVLALTTTPSAPYLLHLHLSSTGCCSVLQPAQLAQRGCPPFTAVHAPLPLDTARWTAANLLLPPSCPSTLPPPALTWCARLAVPCATPPRVGDFFHPAPLACMGGAPVRDRGACVARGGRGAAPAASGCMHLGAGPCVLECRQGQRRPDHAARPPGHSACPACCTSYTHAGAAHAAAPGAAAPQSHSWSRPRAPPASQALVIAYSMLTAAVTCGRAAGAGGRRSGPAVGTCRAAAQRPPFLQPCCACCASSHLWCRWPRASA